jgi:DNA invertase Pin-like site-specific DNA recombinase
LVVTKLDRLARSLPDARDILEGLTARNVKLSLGGSVHDPTDPVGRLLFNVLAMVAEFEADLIRLRTREGMRVAKAKGRGRVARSANRPFACWASVRRRSPSASLLGRLVVGVGVVDALVGR